MYYECLLRHFYKVRKHCRIETHSAFLEIILILRTFVYLQVFEQYVFNKMNDRSCSNLELLYFLNFCFSVISLK